MLPLCYLFSGCYMPFSYQVHFGNDFHLLWRLHYPPTVPTADCFVVGLSFYCRTILLGQAEENGMAMEWREDSTLTSPDVTPSGRPQWRQSVVGIKADSGKAIRQTTFCISRIVASTTGEIQRVVCNKAIPVISASEWCQTWFAGSSRCTNAFWWLPTMLFFCSSSHLFLIPKSFARTLY